MKKQTRDGFIAAAIKKYGNKFDYSKVEYKGSKEKVCVTCPIHGDFLISPNNFLSSTSHGCPKCAKEHQHDSRKIKINEFIKRANKIHSNKYKYFKVVYGKNNREKVTIICPKHGAFLQTPFAHLSGQGCPKCATENVINTIKKTTDYFIKKAKLAHGDRYDYSKSEYNGTHEKICIICKKHGEFWQYASDHIRGAGCPKCRMSHIEEIVENFFIENGIHYEWQKSFKWLKNKQKLLFDFYLPEYNLAIECQGEQHFAPKKDWGGEEKFKKIQKNDLIKKDLSNKNNIHLEYIFYNSDIKEQLKKILLKYEIIPL